MEPARLYRAIGSAIRKERDAKGMTQEALALEVGLSRSSLTNIELGRQRIQLHLLYRIAEALQLEPAKLLPLRDTPSPALAEVLTTASKPTREFMQQVLEGGRHAQTKRADDRGEGERAPARTRRH